MWARLKYRSSGRVSIEILRRGRCVRGTEREIVVLPNIGWVDHLDDADRALVILKLNDALTGVRHPSTGRVEPDRVNHEDLVAKGFGLDRLE